VNMGRLLRVSLVGEEKEPIAAVTEDCRHGGSAL
jgi:hypothetical protein